MDRPATGSWTSQLVLNAAETKVSTAIKYELQTCTAFRFYVAFLNPSGVATLQQDLLDCAKRGVRGRVLVSQYQNFTHPHALRMLMHLENLELRIESRTSMHAKGYFFERPDQERYIIGSSNWTDSGLARNQELNVICKTPSGSDFQQDVTRLFDRVFEQATPVTEEYCRWYEGIWQPRQVVYVPPQRHVFRAVADAVVPQDFKGLPVPNSMQREGLQALMALRDRGESKGLVISATGTGKTYLSAFFAREIEASRVLFVVHRERIARQAMESFRHVLGPSKSYGVYIGANDDVRSDCIFSTVQTLSRPDRLAAFEPDAFDCIIIDESHRAGAKSYAAILEHFQTEFLLGMTATPERTDGLDIFRLFDHNVAFEIRLQRALQEDLLCPFHYYGISDLTVDDEWVDDKTDFNKLTADTRVDHILRTIQQYGSWEPRVRGLMFCSRNAEAKALSEALNDRGLRTVALAGASQETEREDAMTRLELDSEDPRALDYILTVDIFNEGVDIPQVNQIVMLRPTQSTIIFVQQLGRGLRRLAGQEKYLTVIDFIGNYENNFMIPAALYGDTTWNKDKLRKLVVAGNDVMPGASTVNFDRITKERIFESISRARNTALRDLKQEFAAMQGRLGRLPMMMDWHQQGARDPRLFARAAKASYAEFVLRFYPEIASPLPADLCGALKVWTKDALNGTSIEEPTIAEMLLEREIVTVEAVLNQLQLRGFPSTVERVEAAARALNLQFLRDKKDGKMVPFAALFGGEWVRLENGRIAGGTQWQQMGEEGRKWVSDLVCFAKTIFLESSDPMHWRQSFRLGAKYKRADVFRLLNTPVNPVAQNVGGYLVDFDSRTCPIFVTYHKSDEISDTTQYEDAFIDQRHFHWFTRSKRTLATPEVRFFVEASQGAPARIPLFVKKDDDEGTDFYFLGEVHPIAASLREDRMPVKGNAKGVSVVRMDFRLEDPVPTDLYHYLQAR